MTKHLRLVMAVIIASTVHYCAKAQSLGVNTSGAPAAASSILDVSSTDKGILIPRMSKTERNGIANPATGLMVYQNAPDSTGFYFYDGTNWQWLSTAKTVSGWATTGNAGTTANNNFFGTTDDIALSFRQNNKWIGRWNSATKNYFIGDSSGVNTTNFNNVGVGSKTLQKNTTAYANVAIGNNSMQNNVTSLRNTAVGDSSLFSQSFNPGANYFGDNTAIGSKVLFSNQPTTTGNGGKNTAMGSEAMYQNTTGYENTAIGVSALRENTSGYANTAIGRSAARLSKSGYYNSYLGYATGYSDSSGIANTGMGSFALYHHLRGNDNVAIGINAMVSDTSGKSNTVIGSYAGYSGDSTEQTVSIGYASLFFNKADFNTAVGAYAGYSNSRTSINPTQGIENTMIGYAALNGNAFGSQNTVVGHKAMSIFEPGFFTGAAPSRNVAVGDSALNQNKANDNVAIGYKALTNVNATNMGGHVAIGSRALANNVATYPNTAIGISSQDSVTTGMANTSVGAYSLMMNKTGSNNTAIGNWAMHDAYNPQGLNYPFDNTAVGNDALRSTRYFGHVAVGAGVLRSDTSGIYNTSVGFLSMAENRSGSYNVALGTSALRNALTSGGNTSLGTNSMFNHKTSDYNTAVGFESMFYDTSGAYNTAVGWRSLRLNKSGIENTAIGVGALEFSDSSSHNTAIGRGAMFGVAGTKGVSDNVAVGYFAAGNSDSIKKTVNIGYFAGYNNETDENIFIGNSAGFGAGGASLTGSENIGIGASSLMNTTTGKTNTAIGLNVLRYNKTGSNNTAVGVRSLFAGTIGDNNVAVGDSALYTNIGNNNTVIGHLAMSSSTSGNDNVAVGTNALRNNTVGFQNTVIGKDAGSSIFNGNSFTLLGYGSNVAPSSFSNATAIGALAYAGQNNSLVLGSINGINGATVNTSVGIGTSTPNSRLHIRNGGTSGGAFLPNSSMIVEDNIQSYIQLSNPTNTENGLLSGTTATSIRSGMVFSIDSSVYLRAGGNNTRLAIHNSGRVGIGLTTPLTKLHIYESTANNVSARIASVNASYDPGLELVKTGAGADWKVRVDASSWLTFSRATDDFAATPTDYYQMGTNTFRTVADATQTLGQAANRWLTVYAFNGVINTSDAREKENIENLNYGLNEIMKLRPVSYNWKTHPQLGRKIGFIAQEVKPVLAEVVQTGELKEASQNAGADATAETDRLGIYYSDIIPVTVKAIQEQQAEIELIKKENDALKQKNAQLEKDLLLIKEKLGIKN